MPLHSLRANTIIGHRTLCLSMQHSDANPLVTQWLETNESSPDRTNRLPIERSNHWANAGPLIGEHNRTEEIDLALLVHSPGNAFTSKSRSLRRT